MGQDSKIIVDLNKEKSAAYLQLANSGQEAVLSA